MQILAKHYVHRNEAGLIRSMIKEKGRYKVIDKVSVDLNDKLDVYEATFANLGINKVLVSSQTIKEHPKLLISGVWCIADVQYEHTEEKNVPWILDSLKPIQMSHFNFDHYTAARAEFSTDEWIDTLIQSIGFRPAMFDRRTKLHQLVRLIPFCERNYNVIELGPKGTGKSHIYSEFSPHGMLISGGEITVPKLFVENRAPYKIGLVGYWDCVAFDEFAGKKKRVDKALVDILKNYMANKSFSRGVETLGAEASMAFVGNTQHSVPHMLRHSDLFEALPEKYYDSAFLDRLHCYVPGWEFDIIRGEMFTDGFGFVVDYLAEVLRDQRNLDWSQRYAPAFSISSDVSTRDRDGVHKTFSGLMKVLYPHGEATDSEIEEVLQFAMEGRKRVKDQLKRIDTTYAEVEFSYTAADGRKHFVTTREEVEYAEFYHQSSTAGAGTAEEPPEPPQPQPADVAPSVVRPLEVYHDYNLMRRIESAGMAEAFEAEHARTGQPAFVKRVRRRSTDEEALEREIRIYEKLSRLSLSGVLQVIGVLRDDEFLGVVTEYASEGDLEEYVQNASDGGLPVAEAKSIAEAVLSGLAELHANEIVHRDLKPRNILLSDGGWRIADFGISKNLGRLVTQKTFQQHGTLGYGAPEQFDGVEAKPSADIYSVGKIIVFLLTGQTDADYITYPSWRRFVNRCIALDPQQRPTVQEAFSEVTAIPI
ncbi:BREX system Lon protease-like protein BrxL [Aeoliella sp. SH292]|uniref:BREX system Lon protease-like protein BrxL n=1 Tax=Aeoliella sp. SH292 TaxID=3454464 RepID=UPI003F98CA89